MLAIIRRDLCKKPDWINVDIFEEMKKFLSIETYKAKCEKAKKNRSSKVRGNVHTYGSIPLSEHKDRYV